MLKFLVDTGILDILSVTPNLILNSFLILTGTRARNNLSNTVLRLCFTIGLAQPYQYQQETTNNFPV